MIPPLETAELHALLALSLTTLGFLGYHFALEGQLPERWSRHRPDDTAREVRRMLLQRAFGVFFLGLIPLAVLAGFEVPLKDLGLASRNWALTLQWTALLSVPIVALNFFATRSAENLAMYPQLRLREWGWGHVVLSAMSWAAYLLAYEFLFRGLLLFGSLSALGPVPAVALNVSLYSLVHVPKGAREAFGAIPLGLVLCVLTLKTQTIWLAFLVHLALALSNEWFSLWRHPEMRLKR